MVVGQLGVKVIGRVPDAHVSAIRGLIDEFDCRRLIVELKHAPIMFVLVQSREFDAVALRLDRDPILRLG